MKRGISFEIPNKYGSFLWEVLEPFEIDEYVWESGGEESYLVKDEEITETLFSEEISKIDGLVLEELLKENKYYLIFANLQAFTKGKKSVLIETYEEFISSHCQLVMLVVDSTFVTIYCKSENKLEELYQNAELKGFSNLEYVTDENDTRTRLSVW